MSGIVGIINTDGAPVDRDLLRRLTGFLTYRGPDEQAVWVDGHTGFGHTMLRTTDESAKERQPISLDGSVWITADVRVDGRGELRRALGIEPIASVDSMTDVELILHAYHRWETNCMDHLLGDFAFAIWDSRKQRLFCARDHFGVKPFFYARLGNVLVFSNTLNCLRLHPGVGHTLNDVAIGDFLLFAQNQDPATTTFADIRRLPGAHCLTWSPDRFSVSRYWSLPADGHIRYKRSSDYVDQFKEILRRAVDDRLRTSRVAFEMSGGLDSPSIAATAKDILVERGEPFDICAYTCVYDRLIPDRERHFSGLVAKALNIPIRYQAYDDFPLFESPKRGNLREPEPFYIYPKSMADAEFWKTTATRSRVLLTGWDGDALLSESPRFYFRDLLRRGEFAELAAGCAWFIGVKHALPPIGFRTWLKRKVGRYPRRSTYPSWVDAAFASRIDLPTRWAQMNVEPEPAHPTRPLAFAMLSMPNWWAIFERYDPGVTGLPQEARHPLIDRRLVDYALAIPPVPWSIDKHILRCSMAGTLPDAVRLRPKSPLAGDPVFETLRGCPQHWIDDFVPSAGLAKYVVRGAVQRIAGETDSGSVWLNVRPFILDRWLGNSIAYLSATVVESNAEIQDRCFDAT